MRDKDQLNLQKMYQMIRESRAAGPESEEAGEAARALAVEKTLIKSITEDLLATAEHLNNIKPLLGVFGQGAETPEYQQLVDAFSAVQQSLTGLEGRLTSEVEDQPLEPDIPEEGF